MPKQVHEVEGAVEPLGPYSIATEAGGFVFVSGQVPIDPATDAPVPGGVDAQARRVMENVKAILDGLGLEFHDVVKTTIFLADMSDFPAVNQVYGEYFDEGDYPARSTVQVAALPGGYLVEIEAIAAR